MSTTTTAPATKSEAYQRGFNSYKDKFDKIEVEGEYWPESENPFSYDQQKFEDFKQGYIDSMDQYDWNNHSDPRDWYGKKAKG